jgi:hypothetical protein
VGFSAKPRASFIFSISITTGKRTRFVAEVKGEIPRLCCVTSSQICLPDTSSYEAGDFGNISVATFPLNLSRQLIFHRQKIISSLAFHMV